MYTGNNLTDKQKKANEWAEGMVANVNNDRRKFVKCKESRPITDLKDLLVSSCALYGNNIAYLQKYKNDDEFTEIKFSQVLDDVNGLGTALMARGIKERRIAVIGANCYEWCISYLTIAGGLGVVVPLDKELNAKELKSQIMRADVSCICCGKKHEKTFRQIKKDGDTSLELIVSFNEDIPVKPAEDDIALKKRIEQGNDSVISIKHLIAEGKKLIACGNRKYIDAEVDNEALGVLLFTSGTTGKAKGVMLSHKNICTELMVAPTIFTLEPEDRYISFLPLHHTYECTCCFLMAIYKGSSVGFCQGLKYIQKNMTELQPTIMLAVPVLYEKLYSAIWKNVRKQGKEKTLRKVIKLNRMTRKIHIDLGSIFLKDIRAVFGGKMKTLICGGAAINPEILDGLRDFGFNALQGYGLTECAPMGTFNPQDAPNSESVGVPFPGLEIKCINRNKEGIGELCVRGDHVMMGYYDNPEETADVLDEEGWFHTGDLGYIDKDGYTFLTGRLKNVIVTKNGKNVYPEELEYLLGNISFVEESFVFEQNTADNKDTMIAASIRVDDDAVKELLGDTYTDTDVEKLIWSEVDRINTEAPTYRRIRKIIYRKPDFIKNTSQKIIRFAEENRHGKFFSS